MTTKELSNLFILAGDDLPYLSKEARNIECFYNIIVRDKGKQGYVPDINTGKSVNKIIKVKSRKEIAFIYFYLNDDLYSNYANKERIAIICKRIGLDWELDELIWNAISELKIDSIPREEKLINNYYNTLDNYNTLLEEINKQTSKVIELLTKSDDELSSEEKIERKNLLDNARADFKWALDASNQLKTTFKNIDDLKIVKDSKGRKQKSDRLQTDKNVYSRREP